MLPLLPNDSKVIIDASKSINIDLDVVEIIEEFEVNAKHRGIDLTIIERERKGVGNQVDEVESIITNVILPLKQKTKTVNF